MATRKSATPWGKALLVDEVAIRQQAPGREFSTHAQLLETESGERLVRLAYSTAEHGYVRRGPVTLTVADLTRLLAEIDGRPELAAAFGRNGARPRRASGRGLRRRASPG
jgi:hypothetical protein